jgi:GH25 family lysozyme M1 (1,4-beta-N-acetylmuramidase)
MSYTQGEVDALIAAAVAETEETTTEEVSNEFLSTMKEFMTSGETTTAMLRYFFPDDVVVADAGQYYFFPISDELARNTYDSEQFALGDDKFLNYYENGEVISHKGIDVSKYQGEINWEKVAADDIEYAFVRLGIRGYTEGEILEDDTFEDNIEGALDNDIDVGVYFFTQATSVEEAEEEAQYVLDMIEPYDVTYPVVLDVEAVSNSKARTADLTAEERTEYAIAFCEKIRGAGYTPMIYGNLKSFMLMLDLEQLEDYDKWFACYNEDYYYPYEFKIWQYSDVGSVSGISGNVDLNISFERAE